MYQCSPQSMLQACDMISCILTCFFASDTISTWFVKKNNADDDDIISMKYGGTALNKLRNTQLDYNLERSRLNHFRL